MAGGIRGNSPLRPLPTKTKTDKSRNSEAGAALGGLGKGRRSKKGRRKGRSGRSGSLGVGVADGVDIREVDAWEDDLDQQKRKQSFLDLLDADEAVLLNDDVEDLLEPMETIAPEFRPQVSTRMASARSFTSGNTLSRRSADHQKRSKSAKKA